MCIHTHIVLNFWGFKFRKWWFLKISLKYFCEVAHCTCNVVWVWHTSKFYLVHTVTPLSTLKLAAVSKAMPTSKVSLWRASLVDSAGMLSIDALTRDNCSLHGNFFVEIISQTVENSQNSRNWKPTRNLALQCIRKLSYLGVWLVEKFIKFITMSKLVSMSLKVISQNRYHCRSCLLEHWV